MPKRVWSTGKKWMGNLIPLIFVLPFFAAGVLLQVRDHGVTPIGIGLCVLGLVVGWIAVNQFGFWGNASMAADLMRKLLPKAGRNASDGMFVGFASPKYVGTLDAHEDLGFLFIDPDKIEYIGEIHHVVFPRSDVKGVKFRSNIHAFLGLGRWVSIEAIHKGKQVRLLVEPREHRTLLANKRRGTELAGQIRNWRTSDTKKPN